MVELSESFTGYPMTYKEYVMTLNDVQVLKTCIFLQVFHPGLNFDEGFQSSISKACSYLNEKQDNYFAYKNGR